MTDIEPLLQLIKRFEGCRLTPYLCPAGVWTCGWGATGAGVVPGQRWTQAQADHRLLQDAKYYVQQTLILCPDLRGSALCAIADFSYNLGVGRLKSSTLRKRINSGDYDGAKIELMKWVRAGGKVLKGLTLRRQAECLLLS